MRALSALALAIGLVACSEEAPPVRARTHRTEESTLGPRPEPEPAPTAEAEPVVEATPTPLPLGTARDLAGLTVTPNEDGTIRVEGTDRWGGDATATYQSVDFLEPALPVLARSLTPEQVAGLTALCAELRAAAPPVEPAATGESATP